MKWKIDHLPLLVAASTLAMIGLVIFQYKWINHSRELYHEVFHQRACMALCSTLEDYGEGAICSNVTCEVICGTEPTKKQEPPGKNLAENDLFQADLRRTLDFYNIDLSFEMTHSTRAPDTSVQKGQPTCMVSLPPATEEDSASYVTLDFPEKQSFMLSKMKFMTGASIAILFFTAFVLLLANWWLMKQKRLLRTNVEMYNNMAHEFRTPLTNIQLASNLLTQNKDVSKSGKFIDIISRENSKLITQVERILHLARIENGEYALQPEQIHLKSLLDTVVEELEMQIAEKKATIQFDHISEQLILFGDQAHLTNVFRNLIDNALKYSSSNPEIRLSASEHKDGIMISVQDNGIGIPSTDCAMIFEKFQRVHKGDIHEQKGFGLGLAYVKKIVELHKGFIRVDSEVNKGSSFNVYLPKFC